MSFFYSFPSELVRLALRDNSITLEYPRERLYSTILIFYFSSTCLFVLATFAFHGYGVQLLVIHVDLLVFVLFQLYLLNKGLPWAQCILAMAESTFVLTDTVRRDSIRKRNQDTGTQQPRRNNYQNSVLRRPAAEHSETNRVASSDGEPQSINIDMNRLNSALKNGSLFA